MEILSLHDKQFEEILNGLDMVFQETMTKMLEAEASECSVGLKIEVEIVGVDELDRIVPNIKYKITTNVPIKGSHGGRVAEDRRLIRQGGQACLVAGSEQMSML